MLLLWSPDSCLRGVASAYAHALERVAPSNNIRLI